MYIFRMATKQVQDHSKWSSAQRDMNFTLRGCKHVKQACFGLSRSHCARKGIGAVSLCLLNSKNFNFSGAKVSVEYLCTQKIWEIPTKPKMSELVKCLVQGYLCVGTTFLTQATSGIMSRVPQGLGSSEKL